MAKAKRLPRTRAQRGKAAAKIAIQVKQDTAKYKARKARRLRALPILPNTYQIGRTIDGSPIPAWIERSPSTPELVRRLLLLTRRVAQRMLWEEGDRVTKIEKIRPVGKNKKNSDITYGRQVTIKLKGLDVKDLLDLVPRVLSMAFEYVCETVGHEFWSSRFRPIDNVAQRMRFFWGVGMTSNENNITPSQGGEHSDIHFSTRDPVPGRVVESISDFDSAPVGIPNDVFRKGAIARYTGFASNLMRADMHADESALWVRLYLIVPVSRQSLYAIYGARVKRIMGKHAKPKNGKRRVR